MRINQYYKQAVFYPFILVMLLTIVFSTLDNYDYKSEWVTADAVVAITVIWAFFYSLVVSGLSLTILLNNVKKVRASSLLTILSWFLIPVSFIAVNINREINYRIKYQSGKFGNDFIYVLILNLPFVVGLVWSYINFYRAKRCQHQISKTKADEQ